MALPAPEAYLEVRVDVPQSQVELICDFIIENITNGIVLEDEEGSATTTVIFYVPERDTRHQSLLAQFFAKRGGIELAAPSIRSRRVIHGEWLDQYRASVKPIRIAADLIVRPAWVSPTQDRYQIVIEPKMAFGTGSHATTRSCLQVIREQFQPGWRFLDMGCGSGILSLLADQMGALYIKAVDYDLAAVANCRENFDINGVKTPHEIVIGSIEKCSRDEPYHLVCANIIRTTILTMLDRLLKLTAVGGLLVLSGLLDKDEAAISGALRSADQSDFTILHDEEWLTYTVVRK
ncbi:MAG: 50S ribosomal protein L11 methyltransferase [Candidatus Zixiibacteriota bacterium]